MRYRYLALLGALVVVIAGSLALVLMGVVTTMLAMPLTRLAWPGYRWMLRLMAGSRPARKPSFVSRITEAPPDD